VPAGVEDGLLDEVEIVVVESDQGVAEVHRDAFSDACRQAEHLSFAVLLLEHGSSPESRAVIAAGQSMLAICVPSVMLMPVRRNRPVKSRRCSQLAWLIRSSQAASSA
jgi:hypothetical protein